METPLSVQVIPRQVMKDQQAISMGDVIKNVSGIQYSNSYTSYENFLIRGFKTDYDGTSILRNGLRRGANSYDLANIEQVEVLKGPASMMYGRLEPGGVVNFVTKMPLSTPYYSLQQQFGSYDLYRTTIEATGPINKDKTLLYRINFAGQEYAGFRDFMGLDRIFVAPTLTWKASDNTQFNFEFEYKRDTGFFSDQGIPALGNGSRNVAPVAKNFSTGEEWSKDAIDSFVGAFNWSHKFNDNWSIRNSFMTDLTYYKFRDLGANEYIKDAQGRDTTTVNRWLYDANQSRHRYGTNFDILGKFDAFGMEHSTLLGFDYYKQSNPKDDTYFTVLPDEYNIDLLNPVHGAPLPNIPAHNSHFDGYYDWYGLYFQDQAAMFDRKLHILFGGRYDWASIKNVSATKEDFSDASVSRFKDDKFSPRVGIVYRPFNWLSVYGNYTESFGANNGRGIGGGALAPQEATQYEIGLKGEFWDGRLTSSLAYYHLTKSNIPFSSINNVTSLVGEARSQGIEFDISGQITDKFNLIGSFSYTDAIITRDEDALIGKQLFAVPEFFGSVWGKYDISNHFSLGTGIFAATKSPGDRANSFDLPGYVRWDAMAAYRFDIGKTKLTAQVNVSNLLDERYYQHTGGFPERMGVTPASPRTVIGSLRLEY
jgi:iron complex outermembrane recepter protein